jgi:hypothetical protein
MYYTTRSPKVNSKKYRSPKVKESLESDAQVGIIDFHVTIL